MSVPAGRCSHDHCRATSNRRAEEAAFNCGRAAPSGAGYYPGNPTEATINRCGSARPRADGLTAATVDCRNSTGNPSTQSTSHRTDGCRSVRDRGTGESPLPWRHGRVGKPRFQNLSFRRNAELRNHEERCVHVRKGRHRRGVTRREE